MRWSMVCIAALAMAANVLAAEIHVARDGNDANPGTRSSPLRTIQRAADLAQPGDTVTVHEGLYRERVNPPRGGESDDRRIVYRAAPGERVEIRGSEEIRGWVHQQDDVWRVTLPNSFFGDFNPYADPIRGDWFDGRGRTHHTGAVYLDGDWLTEAASLDEVLMPAGDKPAWLTSANTGTLLNVAWFRPAGGADRVPAVSFVEQAGIQTAPCTEGGECIGWIEHGDWTRYEDVDFGAGAERMELRVASATNGGVIQIRLGGPQGEVIGQGRVRSTGDWQRWVSITPEITPQSGVQDLCLLFRADGTDEEILRQRGLNPQLWFAEVGDHNTTLWAQFEGVDPNERLVEINVRQSVFYPDEPGRDYITVRGFTMRHAATPWAPPTAEQIGLLGTHWSKGWVIEDNVISHSMCTGITLGKHGDEHDNTSANTAEGYVATIERAHAFQIPWTKERVGGHIVRNNRISHCEQAGLVGSMGAAFSTIEGNVIHDANMRGLFGGAEMAGIKIHGAIDATIRGNHIYRCIMGIWLDWMAQGTRVTGNLLHDNPGQDLFVEVNHGPFLADNNLFLSATSLLDMSQGGAYAHNLFAGRITNSPEPRRETPFHPAHSTEVAGLRRIEGGDDRFLNNLFIGDGAPVPVAHRGDLREIRWISGRGLWGYDGRPLPLMVAGNVHVFGAEPSAREEAPVVTRGGDPAWELILGDEAAYLKISLDRSLRQASTTLVTTEGLGTAHVTGLPYENPDGTPITVDLDYLGIARSASRPTPGPFEAPGVGTALIRVW